MIVFRWLLPAVSVFPLTSRRSLSKGVTSESFKEMVHLLTERNENLKDIPENVQIYKLVPLKNVEDIEKGTQVVAKVIKPRRRRRNLRFK